jgi:DNA-binding response OmpR family regulator
VKSPSPIIMVVDDEAEFIKLLRINLTAQGYDVVVASNGPEALKTFNSRNIDLVILDIMLPGIDGFQVCERLREISQEVGIVMLSALGLEHDKVTALDRGADDYIMKPFTMDELMARVRAVLRRTNEVSRSASKFFFFGGCKFDPASHRLDFEDGEEVSLTPTESSILKLLVENAGKVVTRRVILTTVWGPEYLNDDHYLWTYIRRLRIKIRDDAEEPRLLFTEHGIGYRFSTDVREHLQELDSSANGVHSRDHRGLGGLKMAC